MMKESTRRWQAAVGRERRGECIGAPSGVSPPKKDDPDGQVS
jgi:hypothetical protein